MSYTRDTDKTASQSVNTHRLTYPSSTHIALVMVYTSPTKVARIVNWNQEGVDNSQIGRNIGVHRTTVARILARFEKSQDPYFVNPKTGRPRKMDVRDTRIAARMLATTEAANAVEVQKKLLKEVSARTINRNLKNHGLVCRVRRSKPYLTKTHKAKRYAWAREHKDWTGEDWARVIFSDESKFMLFKSDGRQYCWIRPGQALDERFTKKTIKHGGGSLMIWGCISGRGMGRLHRIEGIMKGPDYVEILEKSYLGSLKDLKMRRTGNSSAIFQQDNDPKHRCKVAEAWFSQKKIKRLTWPPSSLI